MESILHLCEKHDLPRHRIESGTTVLREGEEGSTLFVLKQGGVRVLRDGIELSVITYPGALFGEISVLVGGAHMATVTTTEDSEFYIIQNAGDILEEHPELGVPVAFVLASRLKSVTFYLAGLEKEFGAREEKISMLNRALMGSPREQSRPSEVSLPG
tara:strand:+ start:920 stop:1393 length:474 start_codon:yes stop_codon:yes gene_type:complete